MCGGVHRSLATRICALLLSLSLGLAGCATRNIQQSPSGRFQLQGGGFNQFSPEQEIQLGREAVQQVRREMPLLADSHPVVQYVRQLGQDLASRAPGPKWPYTFGVVNQKEINAFAVPGGPIFINLGTVQQADDEGQLAGVIAHEITHIALRHSTQQASKQMLAQLPLAVLGGVMPQGIGGQLARLGISFGAQSLFLKYSRDAEREADLLGAQIMADAGFTPYSMVEFFTKLEEQGGPGGAEFLSDHPNPGNRAELVKEAAAKFPARQYQRNSANFERIKSQVAKMQPMSAQQVAEWQRQRAAETAASTGYDAVAPSGQAQVLNHAAFQIAYPGNWEVFGNQNSTVTIAPKPAISDHGISHGVIISGYRPQHGGGLEQVTQELFQQIRQANPQLQLAAQPKTTDVNGTPASVVTMVGPSPLQGPNGPLAERDTLVTMQRPDGMVVFLIFISPERDAQTLGPVYQQMLASLRLRG